MPFLKKSRFLNSSSLLRWGAVALWSAAAPFLCAEDVPPASGGAAPELVRALSGPDAAAEWQASRKLVAMGGAAVPALNEVVGTAGPLQPRLVAAELLGEIGTKPATDALLELLANEKRDLAVRSQIVTQLGYMREKRAVPLIAEWFKEVGPRAIHDVPGPKEEQPSTCYIRHAEALALIGDERGLAILEEFKKKIPQNVGWHGFLTNFVTGAVTNSLEELKEKVAFWTEVRKRRGLEEKSGPLFEHFHSSRVAKFRLHESEVIRRTERGKEIVRELSQQQDRALAQAARALLGSGVMDGP